MKSNKLFLLSTLCALILLSSCGVSEESYEYRKEHGLLKEETRCYIVRDMWSDEDGEVTIYASSMTDGMVKYCQGYIYTDQGDGDIKIVYSDVTKPTMEVVFTDRIHKGVMTENKPYVVYLPKDSKLRFYKRVY